MNHTTNSIDAKIWLQFTWIEEYSLVSSLTCVWRSREDFDHFLTIIYDFLASMDVELSLESKRTTKELKIFLQNRLTSSRFDQKLSFKRERTSIYREIRAKLVGSWPMTRISLLLISAIRSREIGGIVADDADSTPCDFSCPIARNRWDCGP